MDLDQPLTPVESWDELHARARALLHGETHPLANAANLAARHGIQLRGCGQWCGPPFWP